MMYEQEELKAMALSCIPLEVQQQTGKQQVSHFIFSIITLLY